jgi:hypothetical protein
LLDTRTCALASAACSSGREFDWTVTAVAGLVTASCAGALLLWRRDAPGILPVAALSTVCGVLAVGLRLA